MKIPGIGRAVLAASLLGLLAGCESEIAHGLNEKDANEIYVALSKNGIAANKKADPSGGDKGGWMISVPKAAAPHATEILVANHLPPDHQEGFNEVYVKGGTPMVPSATDEKAKFLAAKQGELAQSLESIDGVLSARVNVNIPDVSDLDSTKERPKPSASVIVTYANRGDGKSPIAEDKVKAIVAHAVQDMDPRFVEVALTPANLPGAETGGTSYVDIAGMQMSADSVTTFKAFAALAIVAILGLATWVGLLYMRSGSPAPRRSRAAPEG